MHFCYILFYGHAHEMSLSILDLEFISPINLKWPGGMGG